VDSDNPSKNMDATPSGETLAITRDPTGKFGTGNQFARRHGVAAYQAYGERALSPEFRAELADFRAGVEADQGGASELTTIGAGYVRRLVEVEGVLRLLMADFQQRGFLTHRGNVRSTYNAFMLAIDRWDRLAQRLGIDRRARPVPSLDQVMNGNDPR
jgi:hypothetical protein